jgi:hypothetical protein
LEDHSGGRTDQRHGGGECDQRQPGVLATLPGGLALLVLGPLVALTTSGDAFDRVINGGVITGFGGSGIWASTRLPRLNRWYPRNSMK